MKYFLTFCFSLVAKSALAIEESFFSRTIEAAASQAPGSIITFGYLIQLFFSLLIVFGLIYLVSKYILPKFKIESKGKIIEVLDRVTLEPQVSNYIIRVKNRHYLLGISNKNITLIDKLENL